ncbi:MAG: lytic murein transglycosylase [Janthinobacterium lividum]|jgi:membrane-bound lytic murein transglycosylase B
MLNRRTALLTAAALPLAAPALGQDSFSGFVAGVKAEARRAGISDGTLSAAFAGVAPNQRVIELDRKQPESTMGWAEFRSKILPPAKLQAARENYGREQALLSRVEARFGVDAHVILGIWGAETRFGAIRGNYNLVEALSTLAWEGRRGAYFRKELMNVLRILEAGDVTPAKATGSWAGAMGQPQFMPSSYLTYAVDFDGDGRRDIWESKPDVFGSIGNYLAKSGWRAGEPWGQPVVVPAGFNVAGASRDNRRSLGEWMRDGVMRADGRPFGRSDVMGAVIVPDRTPGGDAFMVYPNFNAIRRYNPSDFYALTVGLLADASA